MTLSASRIPSQRLATYKPIAVLTFLMVSSAIGSTRCCPSTNTESMYPASAVISRYFSLDRLQT